MKKLKIVILDFDDIRNPLLGAGQAKATFEVGRRLVEKGHQVAVISGKYPGYKDRIEEGIEYKHIALGTKNIKLNNASYILTLPFYISRLNADVVVECFTAPITTLLSPLWTKIPVVAIPSSFEAERFSRLYKLPFYLVEKFGLKFYRFFLPYSLYMEEKMRRHNPDVNCLIVPEGIEESFFQIKKNKAKHILFIGRFDIDQKGIDLLLESYAKIAEQIKYPLIIAGRGPDQDKINKAVGRLRLGKYIKVMGPAFGKVKEKLLANSVFVAIPSRHEGFSLFALEALAAGLPVVSFDIPGLWWINDKTVLRARKFDTDSYSQMMLKAIDKSLNLNMSKAARTFAKNFSWDDVANQYEQFFYHMDFLNNNNLMPQKNISKYLNILANRAYNAFLSILL